MDTLAPVTTLSLGGMGIVLLFAFWKYAHAKRSSGAPNS